MNTRDRARIVQVQRGLFSRLEDIAYVEVAGRWYKVPAWLACEWDSDNVVYYRRGNPAIGIRAIIEKYHLTRHVSSPTEEQAIDNVQRQARALWWYFHHSNHPVLYRGVGRRQLLSDVEKRCLHLERKIIYEHPRLSKMERCQLIAAEMTRLERAHFTPRQVYDLLETASEALYRYMLESELRIMRRFRAIVDAQDAEDNHNSVA